MTTITPVKARTDGIRRCQPPDHRVEAGVFEGDEVEEGHVAGRGEGAPCKRPRECEEREKDGGDEPPAEQAVGRFRGACGVV